MIGKTIQQRYKIKNELGRGGMGGARRGNRNQVGTDVRRGAPAGAAGGA